jgi:hypothetical protein
MLPVLGDYRVEARCMLLLAFAKAIESTPFRNTTSNKGMISRTRPGSIRFPGFTRLNLSHFNGTVKARALIRTSFVRVFPRAFKALKKE